MSDETFRPRTLREKYEHDLAELYELRDRMHGAYMELIGGASVASYSLGQRSASYTKATLSELKAALKDIDDQSDEIEAILVGRAQRAKSTFVYAAPSTVFPSWIRG